MIGHRGAPLAAPENTIESFRLALEAGADLVEADVGAGLLVGHPGVERTGPPLPLGDVLDLLAGTAAGIHIDLKDGGIDPAVASLVRERGLVDRVLLSSTSTAQLRRLARVLPEADRALGYPHDRAGVSRFRWPGALVRPAAAALRRLMPARSRLLVRTSGATVLSLHHALVSPEVVRATRSAGAALFAWTVADPDRVLWLAGAGVDGIVTDDPEMAIRLLATLKTP